MEKKIIKLTGCSFLTIGLKISILSCRQSTISCHFVRAHVQCQRLSVRRFRRQVACHYKHNSTVLKTKIARYNSTTCGLGGEHRDRPSLVAAGVEIEDLRHFKNNSQLRTLNRCHSLELDPCTNIDTYTHVHTNTNMLHWASLPFHAFTMLLVWNVLM